MKAAEIRSYTDEQITDTIDELREEWRTLRFDDAVGRLTHTSRIRQIKRDIARLKTIQTERQIADQIAAMAEVSSVSGTAGSDDNAGTRSNGSGRRGRN